MAMRRNTEIGGRGEFRPLPPQFPRIETATSARPPLFRTLLGEAAWHRLAPAIRDRFAVEPAPGRAKVYIGTMTDVRRSVTGGLLAHLCRLIGTPLAPYAGRNVPIRVTVTIDKKSGGETWRRDYDFGKREPSTVTSVKKHDHEAGLMECVGGGFGMKLAISERDGAIHFVSTQYFWQIGPLRIPLPGLLSPGVTHVSHREAGDGWFRFTMEIHHPVLGETFFQDGFLHEIVEG